MQRRRTVPDGLLLVLVSVSFMMTAASALAMLTPDADLFGLPYRVKLSAKAKGTGGHEPKPDQQTPNRSKDQLTAQLLQT